MKKYLVLIFLGCSGYTYGISIMKSFMRENKLETGILFTADPYSKVINNDDKDTKLIFSDASTATFFQSKKRRAHLK